MIADIPVCQTGRRDQVGLTRGIGAGKSTVAKTFTPTRARTLSMPTRSPARWWNRDPEGLRQLVDAFGQEILAADGSLDRPALAAKAFSDDEQRQKLNAITHPLIGARTQALLDAAPTDAIVVQDIPLLVENHSAPFFHFVVIVGPTKNCASTGSPPPAASTRPMRAPRIAAQATDDQRRGRRRLLDNSGTPEQLADAAARL